MDSLNSWLEKGRQAVGILSNPRKSAVAAGAVTGAFSAEANTLRKDLLGRLEAFQQRAAGIGNGVGGSISYLLGGSRATPGADAQPASRPNWMLWAAVVGAGAGLFLIFRRRA